MRSGAAVHIREARIQDLAAVVEIHMVAFPQFFLTFLGPRFLKEFYRGLMDAPGGVLLVAESGGRVGGFVGGAAHEEEFFDWLLATRKWIFVREASLASLRRPSVAPRLWRARRRGSQARHSSADAALLSLGVHPGVSGRGWGASLVEAFSTRLRQLGTPSYVLTTDAGDNDPVNAFYVRQGMTLAREFRTAEGRIMNEYLMSIDDRHEEMRD